MSERVSKNPAESNANNNNNNSLQQGPILCIGSCGFFGNAATANYCSKCYQTVKADLLKKSAEQSGSSSSDSSSLSASAASSSASAAAAATATASSSNPATAVKAAERPVQTKKNRCWTCSKKTGGMGGFECRCGYSFCDAHRLPHQHKCDVDLVRLQQGIISKQNIVVKADKFGGDSEKL
jgi:hypothetical protein